MTDLATPLTTDSHVRRPRALLMLAGGAVGGMALGVAARAWMRLIAEDPAFTWDGTIFIVAGFTIFGLTQATAAVTRRRATRRWTLTLARVVGTIGLLPLFVGAGALMLPTVVGGGLATARVEWRRASRVLCGIVACVPVVIVGIDLIGSFGWSVHTVAGFFAMLTLYATIVRASRATFAVQPGEWRLSRWVRITVFGVLGLMVVRFAVGLALE